MRCRNITIHLSLDVGKFIQFGNSQVSVFIHHSCSWINFYTLQSAWMLFSYLKKIQCRLTSQQEQGRQHFHLPTCWFYFSWFKQSKQGKVLHATINLKGKHSISNLSTFYLGQNNSLQLPSRYHMHNHTNGFRGAKLSTVLEAQSHIAGKRHLRKPKLGVMAAF